jgi:hypothetical protein
MTERAFSPSRRGRTLALAAVGIAMGAGACGTGAERECDASVARLERRGVRVTAAQSPSHGGAPARASVCAFGEAQVALRTRGDVLARLPADQAPPLLTVRLEPASRGRAQEPRVEEGSHELVIDPSSRAVADRSIWLHELAHVHARGPAAKHDLTTKRLRDAIEEGFADYFAASAMRSSSIGSIYGREVRDLAQLTTLATTEWATLPFAGAPFDEHRFGSALAALAFTSHGYDLPLARAALDALRRTNGTGERSPARLVADLAAEAGGRGHDLHVVLTTWLPLELRPQEPAP